MGTFFISILCHSNLESLEKEQVCSKNGRLIPPFLTDILSSPDTPLSKAALVQITKTSADSPIHSSFLAPPILHHTSMFLTLYILITSLIVAPIHPPKSKFE